MLAGVGDVFKALADPTRRTILDELAEREGQTLFELCARLATKHELALTRQAISQHLDVLEHAGLVRTRREGRYKFHALRTAPLQTLTDRWLRPRHATEETWRSTSPASSLTIRTRPCASTPRSSASPRRPRSRSAATAG